MMGHYDDDTDIGMLEEEVRNLKEELAEVKQQGNYWEAKFRSLQEDNHRLRQEINSLRQQEKQVPPLSGALPPIHESGPIYPGM